MKQNSKFNLTVALFLIGFITLSFTSVNLEAENQNNTISSSNLNLESIFIEIKGMDPYQYGDIVKAIRLRDDITVKSACVPASIIMFEITEKNNASLEDNFEMLKGLILQTTSLSDVNLMVGYSEEAFLKRCQDFRRGRS